MDEAKPFLIPKREVWEAFKRVKANQGAAGVDGQSIAEFEANRNWRSPHERGIGMVFQDLALWPHLTMAENIEFGLKARRIASKERRQRIREVADVVGLGDYLDVRPGELSGGEQQRVALARARALRPRILLMDEPLSSLDEALSRKLRAEILRLHAEIGFTLVYVTHSLGEAQDIGTRIAVTGRRAG